MRKVLKPPVYPLIHSPTIIMDGTGLSLNINTTSLTTYTHSISNQWVQTISTWWSVAKSSISTATDLTKDRVGTRTLRKHTMQACAARPLTPPEIHWFLTSAVWTTRCWTVTYSHSLCVGTVRHVFPKTTAGVHSPHWHWDGRLKKKTSWKM